MTTRFDCDAKDIRAAIGPCIGVCCFEVGEEVSKQFTDKYGDVVVIQVSGGKPHVDLRRAIKLQLQDCGLLSENIDDRTRFEFLTIFLTTQLNYLLPYSHVVRSREACRLYVLLVSLINILPVTLCYFSLVIYCS